MFFSPCFLTNIKVSRIFCGFCVGAPGLLSIYFGKKNLFIKGLRDYKQRPQKILLRNIEICQNKTRSNVLILDIGFFCLSILPTFLPMALSELN